MQLQSLTIARSPSYATENAGKWVAQVQYKSPSEETSILLADGVAVELLALVGPMIAKRAAEAGIVNIEAETLYYKTMIMDPAIENIEKMVRALQLAQQVIKDLHQAVSDLQKIAKQHEERIAQVERDAYRANNTASCLANGIKPD